MSGFPNEPLPKNTIAIGRDGHRVTITVTWPDVATAQAMYADLCQQARDGSVTIDIATVPRETLDGP